MKSGDKFIIELGEKTRIQSENSKGEFVATHECFRIDGTGSVISAEDLLNLEEYKENNDEKENIKHVSPEMLGKININPGKGMKKFQEDKQKEQTEGKDSAAGKKFVIEIEKEEEGCYFELKGTNERYFETVCKIKGTDAYIKKADLDKLEEYKKKPTIPREEIEKEGYEKGLNELWEALKQVNKMHLKDYEECTGERFKYNLYSKITPMEFVEKFKEWKEKKKIEVGDEVVFNRDEPFNAVITCIKYSEEKVHDCTLMADNGMMWDYVSPDEIKKTGKHYDEVEKIFQKLKESEGEIPFS